MKQSKEIKIAYCGAKGSFSEQAALGEIGRASCRERVSVAV